MAARDRVERRPTGGGHASGPGGKGCDKGEAARLGGGRGGGSFPGGRDTGGGRLEMGGVLRKRPVGPRPLGPAAGARPGGRLLGCRRGGVFSEDGVAHRGEAPLIPPGSESELNTTFPVLVITGESLPAKRFDDLAGDLPMLTTTLPEFLTGVWEGPESVWRRKGLPVGLSDLPMEHRARLWQPTGRSVDHSQPSLEVWDQLIKQESIWSDPPTEGLDERFPPISPQIQAERDRLRRLRVEAKAETTADKPVVSAPGATATGAGAG